MLRVHGQRNEVGYLVMAPEPERRRRFARPEQAIEYLSELERREPTVPDHAPQKISAPISPSRSFR